MTKNIKNDIQAKINKKFYDSIKTGNIVEVKLLSEFVNIKSKNCDALSVAYESKNHDIVKYLIEQGADDIDDLLCEYVGEGNFEMVNYLLDKKADITGTLLHAAENGKMDMIKLLLDRGADLSIDGGFALSAAHQSENYDIVKYLIDLGVDVDADCNTLLWDYVENDNLEMVKYLLDKKVDVTGSLQYAADNGNMVIVKLLLNNGADVSVDGGYAVAYSALKGHIDIVKYLISLGADVNKIVSDDGAIIKETPLMYAAESGHVDIVKLLLDHGAKPLFTDDDYKRIKNEDILLLIKNHGKDNIGDLMERNKVLQEENDRMRKQLESIRKIVNA